MSTFEGKLKEIPGISIDKFDGENQLSEAFFLSHCHTDHMIGLSSINFQKELVETNRFIYLSHVSAEILKQMYPGLSNSLIELDFHYATVVPLKNKNLVVTPIPAGHCPGSVMFLFESDVTVLYTGDYRINPADIPKFKAFYDSLNNQKKIDSVYLDTTFFLKCYEKFPLRTESLNEICSIIQNWISRSDIHVVALKTSAKYGYEYLFMEIYKQLKMPVHVNDEVYDFYCRIPELDKTVTKCKNETKIHSACGSIYSVICCNTITYKIKTIRISAFRWKNENLQDGISEDVVNTHYVCYSTHASYEEGIELLKFLKPKRIEANVLSKDLQVNAEIQRNIQECLDTDEPRTKKVKLFENQEKIEITNTKTRELSGLETSILDSPPRNHTFE